jgi:hypothetical protein
MEDGNHHSKGFFILRELFETQTEVQIQAASAGSGDMPGVRTCPGPEGTRAGQTGAERGRTRTDLGGSGAVASMTPGVRGGAGFRSVRFMGRETEKLEI